MTSTITPTTLRCAYAEAPLGLETGEVTFSWQVAANARNARQLAWQIQVTRKSVVFDEATTWDSGKIDSAAQLHIAYGGEALQAHVRYHWRVRLWDEAGTASAWSPSSDFAMGILDPCDWQRAQWIRHFHSTLRAVPHLRRDFKLTGEVADARLYATARGLVHLEINGQATSDHCFLPGWTDYSMRLPAHCWDVTALVHQGNNVLGGQLADGWFRGDLTWDRVRGIWGGELGLLAMLRVEYHDGSVDWICSDDQWHSAPGPILTACLLDGEHYDANLVLDGWSRPAFTMDSRWTRVVATDVDDVPIERHKGVPVRELHEFSPTGRWQPGPGRWIVDMGQNFSGYARLKLNVPAGTVIRLRFAEVLTPDREIYVDNLRTALATDIYVAAGDKDETWNPRFTFHGFQYVEMTGFPGVPPQDCITGVFVGSDCPPAGELRCSQPMLEKLASNAVWTQRSNYLEAPTDCPQRDERLGWTGDAQAYIRTAIAFHDVGAFFRKWLQDLDDACMEDGRAPMVAPTGNRRTGKTLIQAAQGCADAAWGDATTICPTTIFACYADQQLLERAYPMMCRYVESYRRTTLPGRKVRYEQPPSADGTKAPILFGDWLSVESETAGEIIRTAFYAHSVRLCRDAAKVLGNESDASQFDREWQEIRADFQKEFLTDEGKIIGRSKPTESQTGYCLALHFDLLPEADRPRAVEWLVADLESHDMHLTTGFVGLPYLLPVLSRFGKTALCYELLLKESYPSWGYEIAHGATSIWERWNGYHHQHGPGDPNMNSYAHYAYGAVCEWLFSDMAGIDSAGEAFSHIRIRPRIGGGLTYAGATHQCIRGTIRSDWRIEDTTLHLEVEIPGNTTAEIHLPTEQVSSILESGHPVATGTSTEPGYTMIAIGAGHYHFTCAHG